MSRWPFPRSASATDTGSFPVVKIWAAWNVPSPLPSNTFTSLPPLSAVMMSRRPLPRSAPAPDRGFKPVGKGARGLKGAVAVAQQHADVAASGVGRDDVEAAVSQVRHRHRLWRCPRREGARGLER